MPWKSTRERSQSYRDRLKEDPVKYEERLKRDRERYIKKKERGVVKPIADLSKREQRKRRRQWRTNQRNYREKMNKGLKVQAYLSTTTPPNSPDSVQPEHDVDPPLTPPSPTSPSPSAQHLSQKQRGRKKVLRNRSKVYAALYKSKAMLGKALQKAEMYRKRYDRLMKKVKQADSPNAKSKKQMATPPHTLRRTLVFHNALLAELRDRYENLSSEREKQLISKIMAGKILKKYRLLKMARTEFGFSAKRMRNNEKRSAALKYTRKKQKNSITTDTEEKIKQFLERDENSRATTGKKETVTQKKMKKQKRFLNEPMAILHEKFKKEYPDIQISYSEFCKKRPFWIIKPTIKDRDTCICKTHANMQLMADKLLQHKVINSSKIEDLVVSLCCSPYTKECMYRECPNCVDKELQISAFDPGAQTFWHTWKAKAEEREKKKKDGTKEKITVHLTVKEKIEGTLHTLLEDFSIDLKQKLGKHVYNIRHQYAALRGLKENLREDEVILHIDFAENFQCKYNSEVQAVHFGDSHHQVSLHTGVAYTWKDVKSLCSISSSFRHDPSAIWAHLTQVLTYLREQHPTATTLHVVSDGPTTQYRSKKNFFLLTNVPYQMGWKRVTWNFLEAGHGKGPADGIGAAVKRRADDLIARGKDIPDARVLLEELKQQKSATELFYIEPDAVEAMDVHVPSELQTIRGTMKIHQVWSRCCFFIHFMVLLLFLNTSYD